MVPRLKGHLKTARHNPYRGDGKKRSRKKERYHARRKLHVKTRIHTRGKGLNKARGDRARVRKIARESKRMAKRGQGRKKGTTPEGPS
jgi:hypothetical protein